MCVTTWGTTSWAMSMSMSRPRSHTCHCPKEETDDIPQATSRVTSKILTLLPSTPNRWKIIGLRAQRPRNPQVGLVERLRAGNFISI
uniref:U2 small nuclear RNA auxiliary factor 1 like 4 n=1 Tax=Myotis myotis TaxID=51298 RepID=A0A7J7SDU9_MYOMY|nr:U2 small nuclear RNA auxiliary factor 1 like 4 [Myotis myotis]